MITLTGKKVSEGIVIGKLVFYKRDERENRRIYVKDVEKEVQRFQKARQKAMAELKELYVTSIREVGEANAAIFEMQQKILEEEEFVDRVVNIVVEEKLNAEYAVQTTAEEILKGVEGEGKEYLQGHGADVKDVALRLLQILSRNWKDRLLTDEPFVLATSELYPSEAVQLDKSKVLGFVTRYGTINSHTAVIARTKNIPSVIGLGEALKNDYDGKTIIIDGFEGKIYIEPDQTTLAKMKQRKSENRTQIQNLERLKGKENITQSGQKIDICANIGSREDIENVLRSDAGRRAVPQRVPVYGKRREAAYRGAAVPGVQAGGGIHGAQESGDPDGGPGRREDRRLPGPGRREKSCHGSPGDPGLPG